MTVRPIINSTTSPISVVNATNSIDNCMCNDSNNNINNNNNSNVSNNIINNFTSRSPLTRSAFPGVVLMSPQSVSKSTSSSFKQLQSSMFLPTRNNNINTTNISTNSGSNDMLSFDDMLDKITYESTNLPSIQHPIPLLPNANSASSVPLIDISYETTPVNNSSYSNNTHLRPINTTTTTTTTNSSTSYNPLLSPNIHSPSPQQYVNPTSPLDQNYPSYLNQQYLDVPSLNNSNNSSADISTSFPTNTYTNMFLQGINHINHWIKNLSVQQQIMAVDNILSVLSDDTLFHIKTKINSILQSSNVDVPFSNHTSPLITTSSNSTTAYNNNNNNSNNNNISSFTFEDQYNPEFLKLHSSLFNNKQIDTSNNISRYLSPKTNQHGNNNNSYNNLTYHPWSPQPVSRKQPIFNMERPKSADPGMFMTKRNPYQHSTSKYFFESSSSSTNTNTKDNKSNNVNSMNNNNNSINFHTTNNNNNNTNIHSASSTNNTMTPENLCNPSLLKNIPAWLKSLRLHKYSNCLGNLPWLKLIYLTDEELEVKGVSALGARRKLLKAFNIVKDCKEKNLIDKSAYLL